MGFSMTSCSFISDNDIKIGILGKLSGEFTDWGKGTRDGIIHAVKECNDSGGIHSRRIRVIIKDVKKYNNLEKAIDEFVKDGVDIVLGPSTSSTAMKIVPFVNKKKVLLFSGSASTIELLGKDDYFFRSVHNDKDIAAILAEFLFKKRGWKNIRSAWSTVNRSSRKGWHDSFKKKIEELGGKVICVGMFETKEDLSKIEKGLLSEKCDGVFLCGGYKEIGKLIQSLKKSAPKIEIAINSGAALQNSPEYFGKPGEHVFTAKPYFKNMESPEYVSFHKSFLKSYSYEPGYIALLGYDAGSVMVKALKGCDKITADTVKEKIVQIKDFLSPMGKISIDRFGDAKRAIHILEIVNGRYVRAKEK